jgi:hypothetical protein
VGLAVGLVLKSFLCHGTKTFFMQAFSQNKKGNRGQQKNFLGGAHSNFY